MGGPKRYSPEVREGAVRMVVDHEKEYDSRWATIRSIAEKIGCSPETLRNWVRQGERNRGIRPELTTEERQHLKEPERENRELRSADETLRKAPAHFAEAEPEETYYRGQEDQALWPDSDDRGSEEAGAVHS